MRKLFTRVDAMRWLGPTVEFVALCERLGIPRVAERAAAQHRAAMPHK